MEAVPMENREGAICGDEKGCRLFLQDRIPARW